MYPRDEWSGKHSLFIKNIPLRYSSERMKNMKDGITRFKHNYGPRAYKIKRDKVPVIPFLSLSSGGRARRREGQKGRLDELWVAEDAKRASGAPPGGSGGWMETATPEAELEKEAAGRQHAVEGI